MNRSEIGPPEMRDVTPAEKAELDRMNGEIGYLFYGEAWPETRERWRQLNGGRG